MHTRTIKTMIPRFARKGDCVIKLNGTLTGRHTAYRNGVLPRREICQPETSTASRRDSGSLLHCRESVLGTSTPNSYLMSLKVAFFTGLTGRFC